MITPLSKATSLGYKTVAKPIMFRQKPDNVHRRLIKVGGFVQRIALLRGLLKCSWAYQNKPYLSQTIHGVTFSNPVGLSAGFDKNFELSPLLKSVGFGFMEGGSLTLHAYSGNPRPWFYRLPKSKSLVVYAGLANQGVNTIINRLKKLPAHTFSDFPLNISVAKTNSKQAATDDAAIADYVGSLVVIKKSGLGSLITLNISCPNTYDGEPFTTPDRLERLLKEVDKLNLRQPLFIKMPSDLDWPRFEALIKVAAKHKVTGLTIHNLQKTRDNLKDDLPDSVKGNLSGKPTRETSNKLIKKTYQKYGQRFTIIGVGGIFSANDAYTKIKLGASLVELITGMIFEGPQLIGQINKGLVESLKKDGLTNISQAVGIDANKKLP